MHKENLPLKIDPFRFAEHALTLEGTLPIKDMPRLCTSLSQSEGDIEVKLEFGVDEQRISFVRGHLSAHLVLECQRCMEPFKHEIADHFLSGIVHTEEEADRLPERYNPLIVKEGELFLNEMIEEELIVGLPIVSMHDPKECKVTLPFANSEMSAAKENPFKVIESLRSKRSAK